MNDSDAKLRRRTVASRILLSYALMALAFVAVTISNVGSQRAAARDAEMMRAGYFPLVLALRNASAGQDTWNTQLNHITSARNPSDKALWFETTLQLGRSRGFSEIRAALARVFDSATLQVVNSQLVSQTRDVEEFLTGDAKLIKNIFEALKQKDSARAESLRDELVTRGAQGRRLLGDLESAVQDQITELLDKARAREGRAVTLLLIWTMLSLLVGALVALYARRVLRPLSHVTARARVVAAGDMSPRPVVYTPDEIGELASTFEAMVLAIREANEKLLTTERLATIGKMAAQVTHEIRNPLSSLALNLELLEEELQEADSETRSLLAAVQGEVERLTALSGRYLSLARSSHPATESEDLGQLAREAVNFLRADLSRSGIEVELAVQGDLPGALVDEGQIRQVLINLIRNAQEAMATPGQVTVGLKHTGDSIDITVDDEGAGIETEHLGRIFDPFFTTKSHGTGLGLVVTREIVEAHGGSITAESLESGGARFRVKLPAARSSDSESLN